VHKEKERRREGEEERRRGGEQHKHQSLYWACGQKK
jgi:hypothetical protein